MISKEGLLPVTMLYALCSILLAVSMPAALGQHRVGARPPHEKWTNSLKPRGTPGPERQHTDRQLTLASGGESFYTILLSADPTGQDKKAAEDLAKYLEQMTDAEFPIVHEGEADTRPDKVISIGRTEALRAAGTPEASANLSKDGYAIAVRDEDLFLLGGSRRGPINAVYVLLEEDLGCRWYDSSEANAVIPHLPQLTFQPIPRAYVPQFEEMRYVVIWEAHSRSIGEVPNTNLVSFNLWNRSMDIDMYRKFPAEWGGIETVSAIHNLHRIISADEYFEQHPEYFSMIDGKRNPVQVCMSNPDVVKILTQYALDYEGRHAALAPRDGPEYCQCPECQALIDREGTPAAPLLNVANQVAEVVGEQQPDKRIWILAYQSTAKPPKTMRPRDNVIVWLCSNSHGFGPATLHLTQTPVFQSYLEGWDSLGAKMVVWEYVTNFGTDMHLCPLPNLHVVDEDIHYLAEHKSVVGILLGGMPGEQGDRGRMRAWIWAKQTWNPSLRTQDLIRDFIYGYYGKAAEPIYRYNELLRHTWDRWHKSMTTVEDKLAQNTPPLSQDFITQAAELFDEAEKLAADDEVLASRVEDARLPLLFQQLLNGLGRAEDTRNPLPADDPYWRTVDRLRDYCDRWQRSRLPGRYDALARAEAAR